MRDGGAYGCAVPRAYANLNPGLAGTRGPALAKNRPDCRQMSGPKDSTSDNCYNFSCYNVVLIEILIA